MENTMADKSKHRITIYPEVEDNHIDGLIIIGNDKLSNTVNPFAFSNPKFLRELMASFTPTGLKSMYYQNHKNNKVSTKKIQIPEFNVYPENKMMPAYKDEFTVENFKAFLFDNEFITFDEKDAEWIQNGINQMTLPEGLVIDLEFRTCNGRMTLARKDFKIQNESNFIPYFNENCPSVYSEKNDKKITGFDHFVFEANKSTYLKLHHYTQLGIKVYTTVNPDENKVIPAIIIEDMKGTPLEVHCCYKNDYIAKEILNELKPNILKENFRSTEYFTVRDIEFLDMILI